VDQSDLRIRFFAFRNREEGGQESVLDHSSTGGPRYSRSFYLRFRLFTIKGSIPKFRIRGLSLAFDSIGYQYKLYITILGPYSTPSLFAVSEFAVFCQNTSTANYEGRLYGLFLIKRFFTLFSSGSKGQNVAQINNKGVQDLFSDILFPAPDDSEESDYPIHIQRLLEESSRILTSPPPPATAPTQSHHSYQVLRTNWLTLVKKLDRFFSVHFLFLTNV
jgi:hypothetical protein